MSEPSDGIRSRRTGGNPEVPFLGFQGRRILTEGQGGDLPESQLVKEKGSDGSSAHPYVSTCINPCKTTAVPTNQCLMPQH